jgi:hypothetical protein
MDNRAPILASLCLALSALAFAQENAPSQATELRLGKSWVLDTRAFTAVSPAECDSDGNAYFRPLIRTLNESSTIVRVDTSKGNTKNYVLPSEINKDRALMDYNVTRSGKVWALLEMRSGGYEILGWGEDGQVDAHIPLRMPGQLFMSWFRVAEDGVILVAGYYPDTVAKDLRGQMYLAVIDKNGTLRKALPSRDLDRVDVSHDAVGPVEMRIAAGQDGNFYVLGHNRILVISEWGNLVRELKFDSPEKDLIAQDLRYGDGLLSIQLDRVDQDHSTYQQFLVLYAATGDVYAWYKLSEEVVKSNPACFLGRAGYLAVAGEHGNMKMLSIPLR